MSDILQRAKGTRDFGPEEKIKRDLILTKIVNIFELFGFNPLETPVMERYELFAYKFGLGEQSDSMRETFKLVDQGNRELVLRPEFTVPFARFVAMNPDLAMPFKRYQIGTVFRDGPIKLGRYREFTQCDVDIVGAEQMTADAEILEVVQNVFSALNLDVEICINNRKFLDDVLAKVGIKTNQREAVIVALDKLDKIGSDGVIKELVDERGVSTKQAQALLEILNAKGDNVALLAKLREQVAESEGLKEIEQTLALVGSDNVRFLPSLARGLAYYTGNVFEVFLKNKKLLSSALAGGGRYDNMIGAYSGEKKIIPAVGLSFGLDVIVDALEKLGDNFAKRTVVDVYVAIIESASSADARGNYKKGLEIARKLRSAGFNVAVDLESRKLKKNIEYAAKQGIRWMIIAGETELKNNQVALRDLEKGEQLVVDIVDIVEKLK
ncbi:MAG: histidine--tRNA ligase [Candidatus Falkowbacteria bacterium]